MANTGTRIIRCANGLTEEASPVSTNTIFVDSIALVGATSGGVDEEDEDAYLDRLTEALQLLSFSLITAPDFEKDARAVAGIERALCLPGYNPADGTTNNALMLCMFPLDAAGAASSAPKREELQARQQAKVPSGVLVKTDSPTITTVDVWSQIIIKETADRVELLTRAPRTGIYELRDDGTNQR